MMTDNLKNSSSNALADGEMRQDELTGNESVTSLLVLALQQQQPVKRIKEILDKVDDINVAIAPYGNRLLHIAVRADCELAVINELLSKGADVNAVDDHGIAPLHLAVFTNNCVEYVHSLMARGANINAKTNSGLTALYAAVVSYRKYKIIKTLLEYGAVTHYKYDNFMAHLGFYTILQKAVGLKATSSALLLIRVIFLRNFKKDFSEISEIMEDPKINSVQYSSYMVKCIKELELMKKTRISRTSSALDFAVFGKHHIAKTLRTNPIMTDSELTVMFPIYNDILKKNIALALERGQYISKFRNVVIYCISTENEEVYLNLDCVEEICSYLTNHELLNLTKAFQITRSRKHL
ncbi:uncharacterized protein [Halyomorpha halys]|uniref:uncharacterized protein n=1 Tax=Halyomorpha halys TaxID=286706 RepID=UPI0006D4ED02|nr:delta-latroinsectotoxin-Lt1a-like [Halyomorpha halys]